MAVKMEKELKTVVVRRNGVKVQTPKTCPNAEFEAKLRTLTRCVDGLVRVYNGAMDGRIVSLNKEYKVANILIDTYEWVTPKEKNRDTGDVYVEVQGVLYPVNIKLIGDSNDSYNNITGMVYNASQLLFGRTSNSKVELATAIAQEEFTEETQNYGVLVVNKTTGRADCFTLFNIDDVYVNPTNGWQFNKDKINTVKRTQAEGQEFVASKVKEFFYLQAKAWNIVNGTA